LRWRYLKGAFQLFAALKDAIAQDSRAQATAALQPGFSSRPEGGIHPMTRFALLDACKLDALDFKFSADQGVQVRARHEGVASGGRGPSLSQVKLSAQGVKDFQREESDLPFVVLFEIEEPISSDAAASDALNLIHLDNGVLTGWLAVVTKEVMACRNE
jgi:hypothetical protein